MTKNYNPNQFTESKKSSIPIETIETIIKTFPEFTNNAAAKKDAEIVYTYTYESGDRKIKQYLTSRLEMAQCDHGEDDFEFQISSSKDKNGEYFVGIYKIPLPPANKRTITDLNYTESDIEDFHKDFEFQEISKVGKAFPKYMRND